MKGPDQMTKLNNPKFRSVQVCFEAACKASRDHSALAAEAFAKYGDHGAQISGCVRDHFPEDVKNALRKLAATVTLNSQSAYDMRPARVRTATIRQLGREVATRDGSGFYGPQANR